jgi:hypothetical protein
MSWLHELSRLHELRWLRFLLPISQPTPFLHVVGWCFALAIPFTVAIIAVIRLRWRRGKGLYDL